ncbi:MAG: hypothetical protein A3F84_17740 [Candidatus Handelsmanbacteria bacterium RIFCSPLOWO2_12_FULL_64_10]|uniref:Uncharacterized protein n=1 Tax=Handelsmanbacteria sp. (strain RIFCSPLOWO2_12_FULL_64_10) TaxID=1817868 RepID=A0A1F6CR00_HANXR|nr:MAG: hypothetical protein A3F84_17740 [Candidatus Handelsmanbacteria bacterium RIFCSPLOWO2_12_FULL_64_10]
MGGSWNNEEDELVKPIRLLRDVVLADDLGGVRKVCADHPELCSERGVFLPFHTAARKGYGDIVTFFLDRGVDPDVAGRYGKESDYNDVLRALHWAAGDGHADVVKLLLERGADVHGKNRYLTPLQYAARRRRPEMVKLLLGHGARMDVLVAAALGLKDRVAASLDVDLSLANARDEFHTTPLHLAAEQWRLEVVTFLFARGADVRAVDRRSNSVLHYAAHYWQWGGQEDTDVVGDEALQQRIMEALIVHGADANAADWNGVTPLHRACRFGYSGIVKVLLEHGADVDARDVTGATPLRRAVKNAGMDLVALLIQRGAGVNARDKKGVSILKAARGKEMKAFLRQHGAKE